MKSDNTSQLEVRQCVINHRNLQEPMRNVSFVVYHNIFVIPQKNRTTRVYFQSVIVILTQKISRVYRNCHRVSNTFFTCEITGKIYNVKKYWCLHNLTRYTHKGTASLTLRRVSEICAASQKSVNHAFVQRSHSSDVCAHAQLKCMCGLHEVYSHITAGSDLSWIVSANIQSCFQVLLFRY